MRFIADAFGVLGAAFHRFIPVQQAERCNPPREEARRVRAIMDPLEARRLLSCSLSGTIVTCTGSSNGDSIVVWQQDSNPTDLLWIDLGAQDWHYDRPDVTQININAAGGNDTVVVGRTGSLQGGEVVEVPVSLSGGDGNDELHAGDHADTIKGEGGDDDLFGFGGADQLYGSYGYDSMEGGSGNDLMYGGDDDDTMKGDAGADNLFGEGGIDDFTVGGDGTSDSVDGGAGSDIVSSSDPGDVLTNI